MLKILGKAASINVRKVLWTCAELGLPFEREDWGADFRASDDPAFVRLNPNAMVAVLIDGDCVLRESNATSPATPSAWPTWRWACRSTAG